MRVLGSLEWLALSSVLLFACAAKPAQDDSPSPTPSAEIAANTQVPACPPGNYWTNVPLYPGAIELTPQRATSSLALGPSRYTKTYRSQDSFEQVLAFFESCTGGRAPEMVDGSAVFDFATSHLSAPEVEHSLRVERSDEGVLITERCDGCY